MEECRSCSNVTMSLGLFANPVHLAFRKQSLLRFLRKRALMTWGFELWRFRLKREGVRHMRRRSSTHGRSCDPEEEAEGFNDFHL